MMVPFWWVKIFCFSELGSKIWKSQGTLTSYRSERFLNFLKRDEKKDSKVTTSLAEAKMLMAEINGFKVLALEEIDPKASYVLRVKAKLARKTLPLYFHYLIPFISHIS